MEDKKKLPTEAMTTWVKTLCCEQTGKLLVVYKNDGKTNMGKDYPAYFYCSNCYTACDGNNNIIGKFDPIQREVINPKTGSIVPYDRNW